MPWGWCESEARNTVLAKKCFSCPPFYRTLVRNWIKTDLSICDLFPWVNPTPSQFCLHRVKTSPLLLRLTHSQGEPCGVPREQPSSPASVRALCRRLIALQCGFQEEIQFDGPPLLDSFPSYVTEVPGCSLGQSNWFVMVNGSSNVKWAVL